MNDQRLTARAGVDHCDLPFRRLHRAQRLITGDLTLSTMMTRVVKAARDVIGVRYAALAVLSEEGAIDEFVQVGLDAATAERLRRTPTGARLAATVEQWPHCVDAARACPGGIEPPQAGSAEFIRSAVTAGDEHYGDLYVADPIGGTFSDVDRELIEALTRSAGSAIAQARSFDRERLSTEWLHASGEVARALLAEADVDLLSEVVERAVSAADAEYGQLIIPTTDGRLQIVATSGLGEADLRGTVLEVEDSELGRIVVEGRAVRIADVSPLLRPGYVNKHGYTAAMIAPLTDAQGVRGSIMLAREAGRAPFGTQELDLFATYAAQVALAMQFADARADTERLQLLDTRHQAARELHDIVMQRLFATGVGLNTLREQLTDDEQAQQLRRYICDLDETIDEIRERVFGTRGDAQAVLPVLSRFPRVARNAARDAGAAVVRSVTKAPRRGRRRSDWRDGTGTPRR